jgi:hypothetical protein
MVVVCAAPDEDTGRDLPVARARISATLVPVGAGAPSSRRREEDDSWRREEDVSRRSDERWAGLRDLREREDERR